MDGGTAYRSESVWRQEEGIVEQIDAALKIDQSGEIHSGLRERTNSSGGFGGG